MECELTDRVELYQSAAELKRNVEQMKDVDHETLKAIVVTFEIWLDAVLDYLRRTGRGEKDGSSDYQRGRKYGRVEGMAEALRIMKDDGDGPPATSSPEVGQ